MIFSNKLQVIRKNKGLTQEQLAQKLSVSRQAVAKWESGQSYPDISNLISMSNLFCVTIDYLVRDEECMKKFDENHNNHLDKLIAFRLEANLNTYAASLNKVASSRPFSHDYSYTQGDYTYYDSYVGNEVFAGEEVIGYKGVEQYAMNYMGKVLSQQFSSHFLKEALRHANFAMPYRGPEYYQSGEYIYKCKVIGDFSWFQGSEEIYYNNEKVYECYFHGGLLK